VGLAKKYAPGQKDWDLSASFESSTTTHSKERYETSIRLAKENPKSVSGGASFGWVKELMSGIDFAQNKAFSIQTPLMIAQAGKDSWVLPQGQEVFCKKALNCKLVKFPGAYHEIYFEDDIYRLPMLESMFAFFENISW